LPLSALMPTMHGVRIIEPSKSESDTCVLYCSLYSSLSRDLVSFSRTLLPVPFKRLSMFLLRFVFPPVFPAFCDFSQRRVESNGRSHYRYCILMANELRFQCFPLPRPRHHRPRQGCDWFLCLKGDVPLAAARHTVYAIETKIISTQCSFSSRYTCIGSNDIKIIELRWYCRLINCCGL
jgi:hypothetical protein